jgi:hypothetical protein
MSGHFLRPGRDGLKIARRFSAGERMEAVAVLSGRLKPSGLQHSILLHRTAAGDGNVPSDEALGYFRLPLRGKLKSVPTSAFLRTLRLFVVKSFGGPF